MKKLSVDEYFSLPESVRPMELVYGVVREPPAPRYGHQSLVTHLVALLDRHVRERQLGRICVSPIDVVLDETAALVVQPDIIFIATGHLDRVNERVWGPPDLVIEVLSPRTAARDRTVKLSWYEQYGVRECWQVDVAGRAIDVIELQPPPARARFVGDSPMSSRVLPQWDASVAEILS